MNGTQQAGAAGIAAASVTLAVTGPACAASVLALLAIASFIFLVALDRRSSPFVTLAIPGGQSSAADCRPVFLSEKGPGESGAPRPDRASGNGRRHSQDEPLESAEEAEHSAALSYEEFTARVEEEAETEEISFLPPYASGAGETAQADSPTATEPWDIEAVDDTDDSESGSRSKMPMPRHFALGTVAVIRKLLEPAEVERILAEQRRYPRLRFGDIAVQLGMLTEPQLQELLLAQQQGVFTDAEIREARDRLREFRDQAGTATKR